MRLPRLVALTIGIALVPSAAGSAAAGPKVIDVYSSLPLQGASSAQTIPMVNGIKLAWEQAPHTAGPFRVNYVSLDDSTAQAGEWDPTRVFNNAKRAALDRRAVYYIGEFNSGASEISIPVLNQAGIAQVSPDNTYDGLTTRALGTAPGEPFKYYPTSRRTFARLTARDEVQAGALLATMRRDGCRVAAIANDREEYGAGLGLLMKSQAHRYGIRIVSDLGFDPRARTYTRLARRIRAAHPGCFMLAGIVPNHAVAVMTAVARALPHAKLYGGDGLCLLSFTGARFHGIARSIARRFTCTSLPMPITAYPGGQAFLEAYHHSFGGRTPSAYAIYGYEAMKLGLDTIASLGDQGNNRQAVVKALFSTRDRHSVLGTYSFDRNGDTTLRSYGVWRPSGPRGRLRFVRNAFR